MQHVMYMYGCGAACSWQEDQLPRPLRQLSLARSVPRKWRRWLRSTRWLSRCGLDGSLARLKALVELDRGVTFADRPRAQTYLENV